MEPDFSILRKTGHFYFALTRAKIRAKLRIFCRAASVDKYVRKMPVPQNGLSRIDASIPF
jgi:hypothetical protein